MQLKFQNFKNVVLFHTRTLDIRVPVTDLHVPVLAHVP